MISISWGVFFKSKILTEKEQKEIIDLLDDITRILKSYDDPEEEHSKATCQK